MKRNIIALKIGCIRMSFCLFQIATVLSCLLLLASCEEKKEEATKEVKGNAKKEQAKEEREGRAMVSDDSLMSALKDKRYLMRQLKCALGEGPCDPVGRKIKSKIFANLQILIWLKCR